MKKVFITLCCVVLLLSSVLLVWCEDNPNITDGCVNGRIIIGSIESGKDSPSYTMAQNYVIGLLDALTKMGYGNKILELYGTNVKTGEIFEAICLYYQNNPTQRSRPVIDVLLSGAK